DSFGRHHLAPRRRGIDMAMPALLVAELGDVDLQRVHGERRQLEAGAAQLRFEIVVQRTSFSRWFCICTEWTSVIPACMTAATCTASIICSGLAPVSRHCVV